jgi:hypothetical protein
VSAAISRRPQANRRDPAEVPPGGDAEQILEVVEVHVDGSDRHRGPIRDLASGGAELAVGEQVEQGVGDGVAGLGRAGRSAVGAGGLDGCFHLDRLRPVHEVAI